MHEFTLETLWQQFNFAPNPAQRHAILHTDGPLYLPAGPGSGKTRVLLWRTVNLILFHGVSPEQIFLATFTEKAAQQLREGVRTLLGAATNYTDRHYDVSQMYVGTVHSLCQRLLMDRRFYPERHRQRTPTLLDDLAQFLHVYRRTRWSALWDGFEGDTFHPDNLSGTINALFANRSASRFAAVSSAIGLFNRLSEECLDPQALCSRGYDPALNGALAALLQVYARYCASLREAAPRTDFSLLQQEALRVLQAAGEPPVFRHVIIDEYQDTNTVQERLFFALARAHGNLCVVGDDDQALYRFRGATVENFVRFPDRCVQHWGRAPRTIALNINYRSRNAIVDAYVGFMDWCDWSREGQPGGRAACPYPGDHWRVPDKGIHAHSADTGPAVVASAEAGSEATCAQIAAFVRRLLDQGTVENANQIAFLFPSLKSVQVGRMKAALEAHGLRVYAPRAGTFLEVEESVAVFGLLLQVFGKPARGDYGGDYQRFHDWIDSAHAAAEMIKKDDQLDAFVGDRRAEIARVQNDLNLLLRVVEERGWDVNAPYDLDTMRRPLAEVKGLSPEARRTLVSAYFDKIVARRAAEGNPFALGAILNRATALDWNVLDLFYRLCGFAHFKALFDLAESGEDEGPVCNLGLISQYLGRFMDSYAAVLTASTLKDGLLRNLLFASYLYVLFRRGESEFENAEDPFPRGRIPFLTVHQSKGLEFPVVVLGNLAKRDMGPQTVETLVRPLLGREGEPLGRMSEFDIMRMFYVALSRAQNLLVLAHTKGAGMTPFAAFKPLLADPDLPRLADLDLADVPGAALKDEAEPRNYSYTSDYLLYQSCPRQYMIFRKYGFVPSRSRTMMFGTLVHRTLDDLHQLLIAQREQRARADAAATTLPGADT